MFLVLSQVLLQILRHLQRNGKLLNGQVIDVACAVLEPDHILAIHDGHDEGDSDDAARETKKQAMIPIPA